MGIELDEQWTEFRRIARERDVLPGGEADWTWAYYSWRVLDAEQKIKAIEDVRTRDEEDYTIGRSLPQNYVKGRWWDRPQRKAKVSKREEAWDRA